MGTDLNIGHVTAYAYAKSKGYTGTEEQFATELAQFAQNAQKVAEDRAAVEQFVDEFLNTTAPAVIQDVTDEGTSQVERVAGAGTAQVTRVGQAGNAQIDAVATAGTTQIGLVTAEGTTQVTRVQDKGDEVIDSIPADYTALTQEVSDLNRQLSDSTTGLDSKAPAIIETVGPAAIASFGDGADGMPVKKLVVNIEPQQDLHGYDNPWPAGGGKNLIPSGVETQTINGVTFTVTSDGVVTCSGTASGRAVFYVARNIPLKAGTYKLNGSPVDALPASCYLNFGGITGISVSEQGTTRDVEFTLAEDANTGYVRIDIASGTNTNGLIFKPMIRLASVTDSTYSPYSNICPISGWTGAEIAGTGKNLLSYSINRLTGSVLDIALDKTRAVFLKAGQTYTLSFDMQNATSWRISIVGFDTTGARLWKDARTRLYGSEFTANSSGEYFVWGGNSSNKTTTIVPIYDSYAMLFFNMGDVSESTVMINQMLELGSTATDYEPYTGNQLSVTFPSEAGTVYGGTLDVTTGELTVDVGFIAFNGTETWIEYPAFKGYYINMNNMGMKSGTRQFGYCNKLKNSNNSESGQTNSFWLGVNSKNLFVIGVYETMGNTITAFKEYLANNNIQFVFPLDTPQTYQLTPKQVTTLLGTNNVWADTGDITVEYPADTKLFIEKLTQPTEDDMTADHAISAGTFFQLGNTLYLATSQIAAGGTITPGTNATKLSLADALNQLNT